MQDNGKKPALRFKGFTDPWEQRKLKELYFQLTERNTDLLPYQKTLSVATMSFKTDGNGAADTSLANYKRLRTGDIAFEGHTSKEFRYGRFVLNDVGDGIMSPRFSALRPLHEMPINFWKYYIHYEPIMRKVLVNSTKAGTMMNELVINDFLQGSILVPSMAEQQAIGRFFKQLDTLITLHQRKYEKLVNIKKSMLDKMFPQNGASVPEIRFKGFTDPWEQRKLGDISEIKTGPFGSTLHADDYVSDGIPIITTEHFKTGSLPTDKYGLPQVSENDFSRLSAYILNAGDIVFSRVGSVDINALITPFQSTWLFSGRVLRVRPQNKNSSQFLHTLLETEDVKNDIRTRAVGQTMPSINTEILKTTPLRLPESTLEQEQLGKYFLNLDTLITLHQRKLEKLQNIKKSCLEKMFV